MNLMWDWLASESEAEVAQERSAAAVSLTSQAQAQAGVAGRRSQKCGAVCAGRLVLAPRDDGLDEMKDREEWMDRVGTTTAVEGVDGGGEGGDAVRRTDVPMCDVRWLCCVIGTGIW